MSSTSAHSIPPGKIILTYEDYRELPNDRNRYEIHDGELSVTPAPNVKHQRSSSRLHFALSQHVLANQIGEVFAASTDVILAPTTVLQPDLIFIGNDRRAIITEQAIEGPPTLVIEILSSSTNRTDRITKAQLYAKNGVPDYWLIDPEQHSVEAYELVGDQYNLVVKAQNAEPFNPTLFPGLSIPLADLWS